MNFIKYISTLLILGSQAIVVHSQINFRNNQFHNYSTPIHANKNNYARNYSSGDSTKYTRNLIFTMRMGFSFLDINTRKGDNIYSAELITGIRFSKYYMAGLGIGRNPIQKDLGLYMSGSTDSIYDNQGNPHRLDAFNLHVLKSNYTFFINQRANLLRSDKISYSLNINSGICFSNFYEISTMYIEGNYFKTTSTGTSLHINPLFSLGIGVRYKINDHSAILIDLETDYIPLLNTDIINLNYLAIKIGYQFGASFGKK